MHHIESNYLIAALSEDRVQVLDVRHSGTADTIVGGTCLERLARSVTVAVKCIPAVSLLK